MLQYLLLALGISLTAQPSLATGQMSDYLVIQADTLMLFSNPLETLPDKARLARDFLHDFNTACWRGYISYWQLSDSRLYLTNVVSYSPDIDIKRLVPLPLLFGDQCKDGRVFAYWVSDELLCPTGQLLKYYHDGYASIYEYETIYQFRQGQLGQKIVFDNRRTKISDYETHGKKLKDFIYSHITWDNLPALPADSVIKVFVRINGNPDGNAPTVDLLFPNTQTIWTTEALRAARSLPEWSIEYKRGRFWPTAYYFPVLFSEKDRRRYTKVR